MVTVSLAEATEDAIKLFFSCKSTIAHSYRDWIILHWPTGESSTNIDTK